MKNTLNNVALAAAVAGLMGGTAVRAMAQTTQNTDHAAKAGVVLVQDKAPAKHACKGQNDCKGQGGGKTAGKNSCKGTGDCATDGSKPKKS